MVCGYFRKNIPCGLLGKCTLIHVNQNLSYEGSFDFCGSGQICYFYCCKIIGYCHSYGKYKVYKTTLPYDMIFTKDDTSTSDEQVEKLTREFNIHYRACISTLIYLLSTKVDLSFVVQKLARFSENPGEVHFELLVHLLRYIRENNNQFYRERSEVNGK